MSRAADVSVLGYSERGALSALLYEIGMSPGALGHLQALWQHVHFPMGDRPLDDIEGAEIIIEQSLSQFGDADAILLLRGRQRRCAVFLEAKVRAQKQRWDIHADWARFSQPSEKVSSSNLFAQLYHKVRFADGLRRGGLGALEEMRDFPARSTRPTRKIGTNPVVLRAVQRIAPYTDHVACVALVPGERAALEAFFRGPLQQGPVAPTPGWDTRGWGGLTWADVAACCQQRGLTHTLRVLDYNRGQIY